MMQYSPKLKTAMEEIKAILSKHDIAGFIVIHTPGHSEFLNHCTTSYSCAVVAPTGVRLQLNSKEVGVDRAKQLAADTYNMVHHLATVISQNAEFYIDMEEQLRTRWGGAPLGSGDMSSHQEQNN